MKEYLVKVKRIVEDEITVQADSIEEAARVGYQICNRFSNADSDVYHELAENIDISFLPIDINTDVREKAYEIEQPNL